MTHESIRSRYPAGEYFVKGQPVGVDQLKVRSMNFGQHWRAEAVESLPYEVKLPLQLAIDLLNWQLPEYIEDARAFPDEDALLDRLLKENGWNADAHYLLHQGPALLRQMLLEEYAHEIISQWFGDGPVSGDGYVLNSCNEVSMERDRIVIYGYCRSTGSSSAYQDF